VLTTKRVLETAGATGVRRVVIASTAAVYGPGAQVPQAEREQAFSDSVYARAKLECEAMARGAAIDTVCLRLFNVYGPGQQAGIVAKLAETVARATSLRIQGDGEQTRDFLHIDDAARAFALALDRANDFRGMPINIGSGAEISINGLVRLGVEVCGRPVKAEYVASRPGDLMRSCADITRARTELGFEPQVSLADGLHALFEESAG
jgi:UDP-glucose 4-epimerase